MVYLVLLFFFSFWFSNQIKCSSIQTLILFGSEEKSRLSVAVFKIWIWICKVPYQSQVEYVRFLQNADFILPKMTFEWNSFFVFHSPTERFLTFSRNSVLEVQFMVWDIFWIANNIGSNGKCCTFGRSQFLYYIFWMKIFIWFTP